MATPIAEVHERWTGDTQYLLAERCINGTYSAQACLAILIFASGDISMIFGVIIAAFTVTGYLAFGSIRGRLRAEDEKIKSGRFQSGIPFVFFAEIRSQSLIIAIFSTVLLGTIGGLLYVAYRGVEMPASTSMLIALNYGKVTCIFFQVWLYAVALYAATMPQPPSRREHSFNVATSAV